MSKMCSIHWIMVSDADNKLIGIASWHDEDISNVYINRKYDVYVKVGPYIPWIRSIAFPDFDHFK